jgi:hypothetical protein
MAVIVYDSEAKEFCRALYVKHGGNADAVERQMRQRYPKWQKYCLYSRGQGKHFRVGWVDEYGFDKSLLLYLQVQQQAVVDDAGKRYLGIKLVADKLQLKALSEAATRDDHYLYRDFCKLEIDARKAAGLGGDNFDSFAAFYERLSGWLREIDTDAAQRLAVNGEVLIARAARFYGEREDTAGADAGSQPPI